MRCTIYMVGDKEMMSFDVESADSVYVSGNSYVIHGFNVRKEPRTIFVPMNNVKKIVVRPND